MSNDPTLTLAWRLIKSSAQLVINAEADSMRLHESQLQKLNLSTIVVRGPQAALGYALRCACNAPPTNERVALSGRFAQISAFTC
jgi:hypothetical protein